MNPFSFSWPFSDCCIDVPHIVAAGFLGQHRLYEEPGVVVSLGYLDAVHAEDVLLEGTVLDEAVAAVGTDVVLLARLGHGVVSTI